MEAVWLLVLYLLTAWTTTELSARSVSIKGAASLQKSKESGALLPAKDGSKPPVAVLNQTSSDQVLKPVSSNDTLKEPVADHVPNVAVVATNMMGNNVAVVAHGVENPTPNVSNPVETHAFIVLQPVGTENFTHSFFFVLPVAVPNVMASDEAVAAPNDTASDVAVVAHNVVAHNLTVGAHNVVGNNVLVGAYHGVATNVAVGAHNVVGNNVRLEAAHLVAHNVGVMANNVVAPNVVAHAVNIVQPTATHAHDAVAADAAMAAPNATTVDKAAADVKRKVAVHQSRWASLKRAIKTSK